MREIALSDRFPYVVKVSDEDYEYLTQWRWTFKRSTRAHNNHVYACRNTTAGSREKKIKIMMHNVVMERKGKPRPSPLHTANHDDHDTLNCQRENLDWATKKKQARHRRPPGTCKPTVQEETPCEPVPF